MILCKARIVGSCQACKYQEDNRCQNQQFPVSNSLNLEPTKCTQWGRLNQRENQQPVADCADFSLKTTTRRRSNYERGTAELLLDPVSALITPIVEPPRTLYADVNYLPRDWSPLTFKSGNSNLGDLNLDLVSVAIMRLSSGIICGFGPRTSSTPRCSQATR